MGSKFPMIPIPQAQAIVLEQTRALSCEAVPLQAALGRILYAPVTSPDSVPPFPASVKVSGHSLSIWDSRWVRRAQRPARRSAQHRMDMQLSPVMDPVIMKSPVRQEQG